MTTTEARIQELEDQLDVRDRKIEELERHVEAIRAVAGVALG